LEVEGKVKLRYIDENKVEIVWRANYENDELANNIALKLENQQSSIQMMGQQEVSLTKNRLFNKEVCDIFET